MTGDGVSIDPDALHTTSRALHELATDAHTGAAVADQLGMDKPMLGGSPPAEILAARYMRLAGRDGLGGVHTQLAEHLGHLGDALHASANDYTERDASARRQFGDLA